jgi:acyl carrier protein
MTDLETRVKQVIIKILDVSEDQLTPKAKIGEDLGADSLSQIEIIMAFEDEFEIEIPDEEAEKIITINDAIEYLQKRI